jgi:MFS family permease
VGSIATTMPFRSPSASTPAEILRRAVARVPGGRLGDRGGTVLVLCLGVVCFVAAYSGLALADSSRWSDAGNSVSIELPLSEEA